MCKIELLFRFCWRKWMLILFLLGKIGVIGQERFHLMLWWASIYRNLLILRGFSLYFFRRRTRNLLQPIIAVFFLHFVGRTLLLRQVEIWFGALDCRKFKIGWLDLFVNACYHCASFKRNRLDFLHYALSYVLWSQKN